MFSSGASHDSDCKNDRIRGIWVRLLSQPSEGDNEASRASDTEVVTDEEATLEFGSDA